jgi:hypothetical protein
MILLKHFVFRHFARAVDEVAELWWQAHEREVTSADASNADAVAVALAALAIVDFAGIISFVGVSVGVVNVVCNDVDGPSAVIAATATVSSDAGTDASLHLGDGSLWCCNRLCISCGVKRGKSVTEESLVVLG